MSEIKTEIDRLLISDPDKSRSVCHIFVAHPTPLEEKSLGKLFFICEIDSIDKINHEIINLIQEEAKNNYYYSEETNLETAFENALQKVNESLHRLITEGISRWLDKFHIIIGVLRKSELILSPIGRLQAFLIHREKIIDILEQGSLVQTKINPLKIFSNIITGQVNPGDQLLFCTGSLLDYFSQEKLKRLISQSEPSESVASLEKILFQADKSTSFGAVVIKLEAIKSPEIASYKSQDVFPSSVSGTQTSMDDLRRQETKTSEYLSPSLIPNVFKSFRQYTDKTNDLIRAKIFKKAPKRRLTENYYRPIKKEESKLKKLPLYIFGTVKWLINKTAAFVKSVINLFKRQGEIKGKIKDLPFRTEQKIHGGVFRFRRLNPRAKRLLILALVILFVFSTSIVIIGQRREANLNAQKRQATIKEIQDKTFEAGSALTYEDEKSAKELLTQARDLLNQIAKKIEKEQYQTLLSGINAEYEKTKHIVNVQNPDLVLDLATLTPPETATGIFSFTNLLYLFNGSEIIKIDPSSKQAETLKTALTDIGQFTLGVKATSSTLLLYQNKNGVVEYNITTKKFTPLSITFSNPDAEVRDLAVYQSRFYYLDVRNNQIYRHQRASNAFGPAVPWITDSNVNIKDGVSLAIDGSIYVLKNNGQVIELTQGKQVDFSLDEIDPKLTSGLKIWTDGTAKYLYVLDPANKRLLQFDKKGQLKNQYTSDQFAELKAFTVSEKDKKAWLLTGTKVFQIDLNI